MLGDGTSTFVPGISTKNAGTTKVQHSDRLGTNKIHTDVSGNTAGTQDYDAFGVLTSTSGVKNSLGFAGGYGYQEDDDTGLKLLGHRLYDPSVGRFLTRDPIGSGTNWYRYCSNNPLKLADPLGIAEEDIRSSGHEKELAEFNLQISTLRDNGEEQAAKDLEAMRDSGRIKVETDPKNSKHFGSGKHAIYHNQETHTLVISADVFKGIDAQPTNIGKTAMGEQFGQALLHEWIHTIDKTEDEALREINAYDYVRRYAARRKAKYPANSRQYRQQEAFERQWSKLEAIYAWFEYLTWRSRFPNE